MPKPTFIPPMLATLVGAARRDAGRARRDHQVLWLAAFAVSVGLATAVAAPAWAAPGFDNERPAGYDVTPKHQSNWEPTVAVDPGVPARVYQLITGISATACKGPCPGTSILFRQIGRASCRERAYM